MKTQRKKIFSMALCIVLLISCFTLPVQCATKLTLGERISDVVFKQEKGKPALDNEERKIAMDLLEMITQIEDLDSLVHLYSKAWSILDEKENTGRLKYYGFTVSGAKGLARFIKDNKTSFELDRIKESFGLVEGVKESKGLFSFLVNEYDERLKKALWIEGASASYPKLNLLIFQMEKILELAKISQVIHQTVYEYDINTKVLSIYKAGAETAFENINAFLDEDIDDTENVMQALDTFTAWFNAPETNAADKQLIYELMKKYFFIRDTGDNIGSLVNQK